MAATPTWCCLPACSWATLEAVRHSANSPSWFNQRSSLLNAADRAPTGISLIPFGAIAVETIHPDQRGISIAIGTWVSGVFTLGGWGIGYLVGVAPDETFILLHPPLPLVGAV